MISAIARIGRRVIAFAATFKYRWRECCTGITEFSVYVSREACGDARRGRAGDGRLSGPALVQTLPSAPHCVIEVRPEADRSQPRGDRDAGRGMTTVVGRVREDPLLHVKFVCLSHNTIRGTAGGAILNAELLVAQRMVS